MKFSLGPKATQQLALYFAKEATRHLLKSEPTDATRAATEFFIQLDEFYEALTSQNEKRIKEAGPDERMIPLTLP